VIFARAFVDPLRISKDKIKAILRRPAIGVRLQGSGVNAKFGLPSQN
jgi:hypothetical protein